MAVTEQPKTYVSNGKQFATKAKADHHDKLIMAREELETAQGRFQKLLAENAITADGHPFEFGLFNDFWQVFKPWNSIPYLRKFSYFCAAWSVREQIEHPEIVEIQDNSSSGDKTIWAPIPELYRSQSAAETALRDARREWLAERAGELGMTVAVKN